jgi:hypothetical protein
VNPGGAHTRSAALAPNCVDPTKVERVDASKDRRGRHTRASDGGRRTTAGNGEERTAAGGSCSRLRRSDGGP